MQKCQNKTSYVSWNICIAYRSKNRGNCLELGNNPLFLVETLKGWSIQCTCAYHSSLSLEVLSWILILLSTAGSLVAGATILLSKARHFMNDKRSIPLRKFLFQRNYELSFFGSGTLFQPRPLLFVQPLCQLIDDLEVCSPIWFIFGASCYYQSGICYSKVGLELFVPRGPLRSAK